MKLSRLIVSAIALIFTMPLWQAKSNVDVPNATNSTCKEAISLLV